MNLEPTPLVKRYIFDSRDRFDHIHSRQRFFKLPITKENLRFVNQLAKSIREEFDTWHRQLIIKGTNSDPYSSINPGNPNGVNPTSGEKEVAWGDDGWPTRQQLNDCNAHHVYQRLSHSDVVVKQYIQVHTTEHSLDAYMTYINDTPFNLLQVIDLFNIYNDAKKAKADWKLNKQQREEHKAWVESQVTKQNKLISRMNK